MTTLNTAKPAASEVIERALREGGKLHTFLSGGGLRVVRIESDTDGLVAYGEHPHIDEALRHTADDFLAGHRAYHHVYGGEYPLYLTGASTPNSELDAWVRQGSTFDARADGDAIVVELHGYERLEVPEDVSRRAIAGEVVTWQSRGYTFESSQIVFCNGDVGYSIVTLSGPDGRPSRRATFYPVVKTGRHATLDGAIAAALAAPSVEKAE